MFYKYEAECFVPACVKIDVFVKTWPEFISK